MTAERELKIKIFITTIGSIKVYLPFNIYKR